MAVVPKLLACVFSKTSDVTAVTVIDVAAVPPVAVIAPVSEILPPADNVKLRPMVEVPICIAPLVSKVTSLAPLFDNETAPVNAFAEFKRIEPAPPLKLDVPGTVNTPVCTIPPDEEIVRFCPTVDAANTVKMLFVKEAAFAPLFDNVTAPVSTFALFNVIAFAPAVKLDVPGTVKTPVCVIAPVDAIVRFCPTVDAANAVAMLFVKETLFVLLFDKVIAPVNALALPKVIA